jgi:hypothetical protein
MENGGTCRERERKKRGKKINKIEEFWPVCCSLLYNNVNKSVCSRPIEATPIYSL